MEKEIIEQFSKKMMEKIEIRRDRYVPMGWRTLDLKRLIQLAYGELAELGEAMHSGDIEHIASEAVDVANYACFIHELAKQEVKNQ